MNLTSFKDIGLKQKIIANSALMIAIILGIIFGSLGVHKFVLGYNKEGIIMLVATVILGIFSLGLLAWVVGLVGFIEGIIYLTKSDEEFYNPGT